MKEYGDAKKDKNVFKGVRTGETKYPLTLVGKGSFTGTRTVTLTVLGKTADGESPLFMGAVKVSPIPDQVYKEGTDYEVSAIADNDRIGIGRDMG